MKFQGESKDAKKCTTCGEAKPPEGGGRFFVNLSQ